ncbi:MAG: ABC transporter permease [Planctomycetes bacterium]|nr:ABC transporter permease [Planctomycetota bacterium]MCW8135597.1 ABC transporter permease [Planctomycetota bacterium]
MIAIRAIAFVFFLLLAAGMVLWQVRHLGNDLAVASSPGWTLGFMAMGGGILALQFIAAALRRKSADNRLLLAIAGVLVLPATALLGALLSAIQARGGNHRRIWEGVLTVGALLGLNVALPLAAGLVLIGGSPGLLAGWSAIKLIFFLVVDYFLGRAILHYFASGASAFVSLRYLRRRVMSMLSVLGVMLGVWALIAVNSVMTGFQKDFREQMRGSLSHVLVKFDSGSVQNLMDESAMRQAEWAVWVARIEADPNQQHAWEDALADAIGRWRDLARDRDDDRLPDSADFARAQPALPDDPPPPLDDKARDFLRRLRTGQGLSRLERECLRDGESVTTPREFYLSRIANLGTEEGRNLRRATEDLVRREWYAPLFRGVLQQQFDKAKSGLMKHTDPSGKPDVEGVSWRVATKTLLTPRSGTRELNDAELVGVDINHEPEISRLGEYVGNAELNMFRDQYVLGPLLNVLGATLGWEHPDSMDAPGYRPMLRFTEDGRGVASERLPADLGRYLAARGFIRSSRKVRWSEFDSVAYLEFSPGRRIYNRVKEAHKAASRSDDLAQLGRILSACERDVRAILQPLADSTPNERFEAVNRTGARIILNEYLGGVGAALYEIESLYYDQQQLIAQFRKESDEVVPAEQKAALTALQDKLFTHAKTAKAKCDDPAAGMAAREQAIAELVAAFERELDEALSAAEAKRHRASIEHLRLMRATLPEAKDVMPMAARLRMRVPLPLSYAVERYETGSAAIAARMEAYRKVLPLRTTMQEGETAEEYMRRARIENLRPEPDKPGIILGDALAEMALGAGVAIGDSIAVTIPRIYYEDNRLTPRTSEVWFRVTGFFRSGLYEENRRRMYCDFEELTRLLCDTEIHYTLGVRLSDYSIYEGQARSDRLKTEVRRALQDQNVRYASVSVWEDESRTLLDAVNTERTLIQLIVSFIILLTGGVIFILVYQLVNEKVKDIGILKALGYSPWGIRSVFMFNALFIGLFGALVGGAIGMVTSEYLNQIEDFIDEGTGIRLFPPEIYFLTYIPSIKGPELLQLATDIVAPVVMFSFLCGIYPAMVAARKDPVEALHYE